MVKGGLDSSLIDRLEKLEQALFGGKLEELLFKENTASPSLFDDILERVIFLITLDLALEGKVGVTSALLADMTNKTKNTVNVRLERLYYKRLIQRQQIGNAILYYVPLHELLLSAVTKELIQLKKDLDKTLEGLSEEELEKNLLAKYLTNVNMIFRRSKDYLISASNETDSVTINLKEELLDSM
ncbi:MAG: hypothetical protein ACFFBD_20080 [Candidatus Hodarchaeota archaeon]